MTERFPGLPVPGLYICCRICRGFWVIIWAMPCEDLWRFVRHHWKAKLLLISEQETSEFSGLESVTHIRESFDPDRTDLPLVLQQSYLNSCRCRMYEDMNYWINCAWLTIGFTVIIWILNGLLGGTRWCGTRMHTAFLTRKRIPFLYGHLVHWRCLCFSHSCNLPLAACRLLILLMGLIYIAFCEQTLAFFLQVRIALEGFWKEWESQPKISTGARMISKKQRRTALAHCWCCHAQVSGISADSALHVPSNLPLWWLSHVEPGPALWAWHSWVKLRPGDQSGRSRERWQESRSSWRDTRTGGTGNTGIRRRLQAREVDVSFSASCFV